MEYYSPKWMAWGGLFSSLIASLSLPLFGFVLSRYVFLIALPIDTAEHRDTFIKERNFWSLMFLILVLGIGISTFCQKILFGLGGENLTLKLRITLFKSILRKHVGWFDSEDKAPGILTNIITEDISHVNGLTTEVVGILCEAALGLTVSCLICAIFSW